MVTEPITVKTEPVVQSEASPGVLTRLNSPVADLVARTPLRLRSKLFAALLFIVGLLVILGVIGLEVLSGVNARTETLIESGRKVAQFRVVEHDVDRLMVAISTAAWMPGQGAVERATAQVEQFQRDLTRLPVTGADEAAVFTQLAAEADKFAASLKRIIELTASGNVDQAGAILMNQAQPSANRLEELAHNLVQTVEGHVFANIDSTRRAFRNAQLIVIGFVIASILAAIYLDHTISMIVVRPLRSIGTQLSRIATGDFAGSVIVPNRDELGELADNVNRTSEQLGKAYTELEVEKNRSEELLSHILPRRIIERMENGETVIADHIPEATILFSDLAGFTALSDTMVPEEIVEMLDVLFSRFDALAARYGLEKIKTIGDGYMVAGGVPEARPDHAAAVAEMALAMRSATDVATRALGVLGQPLRVRIGMHSGPLIGGVLGTNKLIYDVWGDTVNTASRMEKYGEAGKINVSAETRALLGNQFRFESRGLIEIKGKGQLETFFLERHIGPRMHRNDRRRRT